MKILEQKSGSKEVKRVSKKEKEGIQNIEIINERNVALEYRAISCEEVNASQNTNSIKKYIEVQPIKNKM